MGLGGENMTKGLSARDKIDARIKAFSGATPGGDSYAKEFAAYSKDPNAYGMKKIVKRKPVAKVSPARKKVINRNDKYNAMLSAAESNQKNKALFANGIGSVVKKAFSGN